VTAGERPAPVIEFDFQTARPDRIAHLTAPIVLAHALLPHLAARTRAVIVNVNSGLGFVPKRTAAVYSATKAACGCSRPDFACS